MGTTPEPAPPVAPITVDIRIGAEDWNYVVHRLQELAHKAELRDPSSFRLYGGGGGGSYHATAETREVTPEAYRAELAAWSEGRRAARRESADA